jgi:RNA-dependent RNA polymerase
MKFFELSKIWETKNNGTSEHCYVIVLDAPPIFHRQTSTTAFNSEIAWRASDTWYRQTSVVHNPLSQANISTNLRKSGQIIDTGQSP